MTWGNTFSILALTVSIAAAYFALRAARANERANYLSRLNVLFDLQTHYQSQLERNAEFAKSFPNTVGGRKAEESLGALDTKIREIAREIGKYHAKVVCSEAPNMGQIIDHLNEKILVSNLLFASVGASSRNMASFSGWLLAGFAGVAAVVLNNLAEVSNHLSPFALHVIFTSFFVSAILAIVARILSVLVVAASTGSAIGRAEGTAAANSGPPPDVARSITHSTRCWWYRSTMPPINLNIRYCSASPAATSRIVSISGQ